jgi:hypothetical protein
MIETSYNGIRLQRTWFLMDLITFLPGNLVHKFMNYILCGFVFFYCFFLGRLKRIRLQKVPDLWT